MNNVYIDQLINDTKAQTDLRKTRYDSAVSFLLKGDQWTADDEDKENITDKDVKLTFNQIGEFVEFYLTKLFPRDTLTNTVSIGVNIKNEDDAEKAKKYEKEILRTYFENQIVSLLLEQGQNFFVGGNACMYYPFDSQIQKQRIFSVDPSNVYVKFDGVRISEIAFIEQAEPFGALRETGLFQKVQQFFGAKKYEGKKKIVYWSIDRHIETIDHEVVVDEKNELGYIPFSWIPNRPSPHSREGRPEVGENLKTLQREFNIRASNFAQRVRKNTDAKAILKSKLSLSTVAGSSKDGKIFQINPEDGYDEIVTPENQEHLNYLEMIRGELKRSKGMNSATDGEIKTHVSGVTMAYAMAPLLDKIGLRRVYWDFFFRELNSAILKSKFEVDGIDAEPVYNSILAVDYDQRVVNVVSMFEANLISMDKALDVLHGTDISLDEKEKIMKDLETIKKEKTSPGSSGDEDILNLT